MQDRKFPATVKSSPHNHLVAIVTPVVRFPLSADEEISIRHLREYLGGFDRYIIGPKSLPKEFSDFALRPFPSRYFASRFGYNHLLLTNEFFRAFEHYEYILIYQLDCLVFASNLEEWCRKGWDYVGAPWMNNTEDPTQGFSGVGNGGLSLRRVSSALAVLTSKRLLEDPIVRARKVGRRSEFIYKLVNSAPGLKRSMEAAKTLLHRYGYHNNVRWLARQFAESNMHEDLFWAVEAPKVLTGFCIPAPREALEFSFELVPRYCFKANSGRLPFGCHAWSKYDREFWEPFLLQ